MGVIIKSRSDSCGVGGVGVKIVFYTCDVKKSAHFDEDGKR